MSIRTNVTGATRTQIGTGPATAQLISVGTPAMVICAATAPSTDIDGLILVNQGDSHTFTESDAIWAQAVNSATTAILAVQPEAS